MLCNFKHQAHLLSNLSTVDALLHDTAAMFMACYLYALVYHGVINKLVELRLPCEQNLLDDMITIDVFRKLSYSILQER